MAFKVTGITRNNAGAILGSCECFLFKYNVTTHVFAQIGAMVTSDALTGAFLFSGIGDNAAAYCVAAFKDGSPAVIDVTPRNLTPVTESIGVGSYASDIASYKGYWGPRAYSAAKATALAPVMGLTVNTGGTTTVIHLTAGGVLNNAELDSIDVTGGPPIVSALYDQVGGADFPATGGIAGWWIFRRNYFGTDVHGFEVVAPGTFNFAIGTFPNTAQNFIFTVGFKRLSALAAGTVNILFGSNVTAAVYGAVLANGDVNMTQDGSFVGVTLTGAVTPDAPTASLWQFNGAGSAMNFNGVDHVVDTGGANVITDNAMGIGLIAGGTNCFGGIISEFGFMDTATVAANSINATKRSAITNELLAYMT